MQDWKQAYSLAKLELKESKSGLLFAFVFTMFILYFIATSLESYLDNGYAGYDFFFIILFTFAGIWTMPKEFQSKKINADLMASPVLMMHKQLPIKDNVIIKSRFIIYFFYSFPFQLISLIAFYLLTPLYGMLSFSSFIALAIIWLAFGIYVGYAIPASEAGIKGASATTLGSIIITIVSFIGLLFVFTFIHFLSGNGIVYWSIIFAQKWPLLSVIISIVLASLAFRYYKRSMKKKMDELDYL